MSLYEKVSSLLTLDSDLRYTSYKWFGLHNGNYSGGLPKALDKKYQKACNTGGAGDDTSEFLIYFMLKAHKMLDKLAKKNKIQINNELYKTFDEVIFDTFGDGGTTEFGKFYYNSKCEKSSY
jgi:hypothetical protein